MLKSDVLFFNAHLPMDNVLRSECQCPERDENQSSDRNFFTAKYSNFAVECDWYSKTSRNVQNLGFFQKKSWGLFKKKLVFFEIDKSGKFAVEYASDDTSLEYLFYINCEAFR